jgi:hypothetical protein
MRTIKTDLKERVETGAVKFDNDWPGLFIRGDDCLSLKIIIERIIQIPHLDSYDYLTLRDYLRMIRDATK